MPSTIDLKHTHTQNPTRYTFMKIQNRKDREEPITFQKEQEKIIANRNWNGSVSIVN